MELDILHLPSLSIVQSEAENEDVDEFGRDYKINDLLATDRSITFEYTTEDEPSILSARGTIDELLGLLPVWKRKIERQRLKLEKL